MGKHFLDGLTRPGRGQSDLSNPIDHSPVALQNRVRLQPANSTMNPIFIPKTQWDQEWQIQGKVVAIFRKCYAA